MGGKEAKLRRKEQRLSLQGSHDNSGASDSKEYKRKAESAPSNSRSFNKSPRNGSNSGFQDRNGGPPRGGRGGGRGGDFNRGGRGGDFNRGGRGGDFNRGGRGGDFNRGGRGGDFNRGGRGGDFNRGGRGGDFNRGGRGGGFNKGGRGGDFNRGGSGRSFQDGNGPPGRGFPPRRDFNNRFPSKPTVHKANKENKYKKPKHMKRKLDGADDETREKILNVMQQWEEIKSTLNKKTEEQESSKQTPPQDSPHVKAQKQQQEQEPSSSKPKESEKKIAKPVLKAKVIRAVPGREKRDILNETGVIPVVTEATVTPTIAPTTKNSKGNDSDSDSDTDLEEVTTRQRGKRRRGRKAREQAEEADEVAEENEEPQLNDEEAEKELDTQESITKNEDSDSSTEEETKENKKTSKKDDKRRCIGRKPVSDFVLGNRYSGKVVYMKPFGAFIDLGCHSDAFCHVSRVQDDFVKSPNDVLHVGDEVSARIVEIDREKKRLTVSLQSDARAEDERASMEAKVVREGRRKTPKKGTPHSGPPDTATPKEKELKSVPAPFDSSAPIDESQMTPAEVKRARKLSRRAERRSQQEEAVTSV